ncbi:UDP-N-acetylmuramoyl-tripeptide--D-alanyl-D-alanine ligase [Rapidithrix thailandica]|uniref:UDP-N-acetylmuramoyl-tripeptide--D-alanyl-D-alanine ligase n=1 Tax=Rapidithrix thailandica TaxID=413964 RepID=A0AAW9RP53_9BACT
MDLEKLYHYFLDCNGVCTDTRQLQAGQLFIALKGPNFNGNKFAKQALENGAKYALIDEAQYQSSEQCLLVDDCLKTLQQLARHHRRQFNIPFIAITGSNGKTTTKELSFEVLKKKYKTAATPGNFNNHIGVPLTLLALEKDIEIAIIELGDNHLGEITELCQIAEPDFGLITNIGKDHLEGFGSFENNVRAKSELYHYLIQHGGKAFIHSQDPLLANMAKRFEKPVFYGNEGDFSNAEFIGADPYIRYRLNQEVISTQLLGKYNFENIQTALCIGKYFEIETADMNDAIRNYLPSNNRSQLIQQGKNEILLDAYNANPSSIEAAVESFSQMKTEKAKIIILGDMYELGEISKEEHRKIVDLVESKNFYLNLFCGEHFFNAKSKDSLFFRHKSDLETYLREQKISKGFILVKGSRGMALESVLKSL